MQSYEQVITIDLMSHGVKNKGKMSDQKTVIQFREHAKDKLSYWLNVAKGLASFGYNSRPVFA